MNTDIKHQNLTEKAQLLNYLKATECEIGLLLNFGPGATVCRFTFDNAKKNIRVLPRPSAAENPQ